MIRNCGGVSRRKKSKMKVPSYAYKTNDNIHCSYHIETPHSLWLQSTNSLPNDHFLSSDQSNNTSKYQSSLLISFVTSPSCSSRIYSQKTSLFHRLKTMIRQFYTPRQLFGIPPYCHAF